MRAGGAGWLLRLARDSKAFECDWAAWGGSPPTDKVMSLYDCVVSIEPLHMCITNSLAATHEFGFVPGWRRAGVCYGGGWGAAAWRRRVSVRRECWRWPTR